MLITDEGIDYPEQIHSPDENVDYQEMNHIINLPGSNKLHPRNTPNGTGSFGGTRKQNAAADIYPQAMSTETSVKK